MYTWSKEIDEAVDDAVEELCDLYPGSNVSLREVIDDRGVVAVLVAAGEGRLVVAARSVDLVAVAWPWPDGFESMYGVLPRHEIPTVDEVINGLVVVP